MMRAMSGILATRLRKSFVPSMLKGPFPCPCPFLTGLFLLLGLMRGRETGGGEEEEDVDEEGLGEEEEDGGGRWLLSIFYKSNKTRVPR